MGQFQRLDLNLLSVLVALIETGSASEAAVRLGIAQPTVSGALARLRQHFNDPLFIRTPGGMTPTPRGAQLASTARDILRQVDERLQCDTPFDPATDHRPFTFALSDVGEIVFLPRLVRRLAQLSPGTPVRSVSLCPMALAEQLASGNVDLAVGYFPDLTMADFFQQQLFVHHFVCLLRSRHRLGRYALSAHLLVAQGAGSDTAGRFYKSVASWRPLRLPVASAAMAGPNV